MGHMCSKAHWGISHINLSSGLRFAKCFGFETVENGQKMDLTLQGETRLVPRGLKIGPEVPKDAPEVLNEKTKLWVEGLRNRTKFWGEGLG